MMEDAASTPEITDSAIAAPEIASNEMTDPGIADPEAAAREAKRVLVLGIVGLALSWLGLPGIIVSASGRSRAKAWRKAYGPATGRVKAGRVLSLIALSLSVLAMAVWILLIVFYVFMAWVILHTSTALPQNLSLKDLPEFIGMIF